MLKPILFTLLIALPLAAQQSSLPTSVQNTLLVEITPLDGTVYHVQGVDLDKDHIWVTSVDGEAHKAWLHEFNRKTAKLEHQIELTDGARYHAGGFSLYGNSIWIPVAEDKPHSTAVLIELDKHKLTIKRKIFVPDHIGCLAVTENTLVAGNWDSRQLYVFNMKGKQLRVIDTPPNTSYQDIKIDGGFLVGANSPSETVGSVDWYEWPSTSSSTLPQSFQPVRSLRAGITARKRILTGEGMAIKGNDLYLLPEDNPTRLFHFKVSPQ